LYDCTARTKVATAGEKRRPAIDASDTSRVISGSTTMRVSNPWMTGENAGMKVMPIPASTIA
jgi:hypothetical protein